MNRELLIKQVKDEYARLAALENQQHFHNQTFQNVPPDEYYEHALEKAIREIQAGKFDDCISGMEVVERIANKRDKAESIQDTIESTLDNMMQDYEKLATETDRKKIHELEAKNARRAEAIPEFHKELKEEQAREELSYDSPNVIGGGNRFNTNPGRFNESE